MQSFSQFEQLDVYHVGFAVDDVEATVEAWTRLYGAGPFFYFRNFNYDDLYYMGEPIQLEDTAAFGRCGRQFVEFVKYDFGVSVPDLEATLGLRQGCAMNHMGFLAQDAADASARLEALGIPMFLNGSMAGNTFYMHDARSEIGHCIEVYSNQDLGIVNRFHGAMSSWADGWNGDQPLRKELPSDLQAEMAKIIMQG